jgi:hypothetical protein
MQGMHYKALSYYLQISSIALVESLKLATEWCPDFDLDQCPLVYSPFGTRCSILPKFACKDHELQIEFLEEQNTTLALGVDLDC